VTTKIAVSELTNILFARGYAYDILRRFFVEEPSKEYVKHFVQQNMLEQFPFINDSEGIQQGVNEVKQYLNEYDIVNNLTHFDDLHWDYTRMFIGPFELPVPPWESVYTSKESLLFQKTTMDVRKEYRKFDIEVKELNLEADDHIGLELDFMYHLNELCMKSANEQTEHSFKEIHYLLQEQQDFLQTHLLSFVSQFTDKVIESADTKFYAGMAKILKHYLQMDSEVLKELLIIDLTY
jgi:TorA maturation chaperone TorD